MRTNWPLVAGIIAVLSVPFALAVLEDTAKEEAAEAPGPAPAWEERDPPPPPAGSREPGARWQEVRAMGLDFFDEVFFQGEGAGGPALAGPLAGADFGMPPEELERAAPRLAEWAGLGSTRFPELHASLFYEAPGVGLSQVVLSFPDDGTARRLLASRWGAPLEASGPPNGPRLWLNPELGVRLALHQQPSRARVELSPYWPLEALIAPEGGATFGFERIPLLGARREEVRRAYGDELLPAAAADGELTLELPPSTYSRAPTDVTLELEERRVRALRFQLDCSYAGSCEAALRALSEDAGSILGQGSGPLEVAFPDHQVTLDLKAPLGGAEVRITPR